MPPADEMANANSAAAGSIPCVELRYSSAALRRVATQVRCMQRRLDSSTDCQQTQNGTPRSLRHPPEGRHSCLRSAQQ